ncbi:MAG: hypothetical protein ACT4O0_14935 [Pseudonocardia sp.]|jgi:hypothetical protein
MHCPACGWPQAETYSVVSTHSTSEGWVRYLRCPCGRLVVQVHPRYTRTDRPADVVASARPAGAQC